MRFEWEKLGKIFAPDSGAGWGSNYAQVPFTLKFEDRVRVYYSTRGPRDQSGQFVSAPAYVDFSLENFPMRMGASSGPILKCGPPGDFDHFGAMAGSIVRSERGLVLYYCGWDRSVAVPYQWNIGIALGNQDGTKFTRELPGPLFGPTTAEPFLFACPVVFQFEGQWRMFYLGGNRWFENAEGGLESQYLLKAATSVDGYEWERDGIPLLPTVVPDESQTSATVIQIDHLFYLFFSYRFGEGFRESSVKGYRIGMAVSEDLKIWERVDAESGIDVSEEGWDSEMVAYPHLFSIDNQVYMLYCGNEFGSQGFGLARLQTSLEGKSWGVLSSFGD